MSTIASLTGMQAAALLFDRTAAQMSEFAAPTDVAEQVTHLMQASVALNASAAAARTDDDTQRSLIDVLA